MAWPLATGGAADAFPVFGCVVEPAFTDASWAAAVAALFTARLPSSAVDQHVVPPRKQQRRRRPSFTFILLSMLERRPCSEGDFFGSPLCPVAQIFLALRASNKGVQVGMVGRSVEASRFG